MNNLTLTQQENQAWQEIKCKFSENVFENLESYFSSFSIHERTLLEKCLSFTFQYKRIYFSIKWLSDQIGCGVTKTKEILKKLKNDGIISWIKRSHQNTNLYKIAVDFYAPKVQAKLGHIFSILRDVKNRLTINTIKYVRPRFNIKNNKDLKLYKKVIENTPQEERLIYINILMSWDGISPTLKSEDYKNWTLEQIFNLCAFPEFIIEEADFCRQATYGSLDTVKYMFKVCYDKANRLGIIPNWGWVNRLKDMYSARIKYEIYRKERNKKCIPFFLVKAANMNQSNPFEEENESTYEYKKPGGNAPRGNPQKRRQGESAEPRRSPDGISPMVVKERQPDRLLQLEELQERLEKYNAMADRRLAELFTNGLMNRQMDLINNLSPQELEYWNIRKGV